MWRQAGERESIRVLKVAKGSWRMKTFRCGSKEVAQQGLWSGQSTEASLQRVKTSRAGEKLRQPE